MPAPQTTIPSVDVAIKAGGNIVGATTGGTLTASQASDEAVHDGAASWTDFTTGTRSWSVQAEGILDKTGGSLITGHDDGTAPLSVTAGGNAVKGLTEAQLTLSQNLAEIVNATTGLTRTLNPTRRSAELALSFDYYDPLATGSEGFKALQDRLIGVADGALAVVFGVGGLELSFQGRPSTSTLTKSTEDILKAGLTIAVAGAITDGSSGLGAGLTALLAAYFGRTPLTVLVGTTTADASEYSGSAYVSQVGLTVPFAGQATVSATLEGSGALTRSATA